MQKTTLACIGLIALVAGRAAAVTVAAQGAPIAPGKSGPVCFVLTENDGQVSGIQMDVGWQNGCSVDLGNDGEARCTVNPDTNRTTFKTKVTAGGLQLRAIMLNIADTTPIPADVSELFCCSFSAAAKATGMPCTFALSNVIASSSTGNRLPVSYPPAPQMPAANSAMVEGGAPAVPAVPAGGSGSGNPAASGSGGTGSSSSGSSATTGTSGNTGTTGSGNVAGSRPGAGTGDGVGIPAAQAVPAVPQVPGMPQVPGVQAPGGVQLPAATIPVSEQTVKAALSKFTPKATVAKGTPTAKSTSKETPKPKGTPTPEKKDDKTAKKTPTAEE
ncbi:MAG: hypothetical protein HY270_21625 [Deltaproteobacteria bacterium]|nr:hypothetical protein [Deltaproteobacteria bacterium]